MPELDKCVIATYSFDEILGMCEDDLTGMLGCRFEGEYTVIKDGAGFAIELKSYDDEEEEDDDISDLLLTAEDFEDEIGKVIDEVSELL